MVRRDRCGLWLDRSRLLRMTVMPRRHLGSWLELNESSTTVHRAERPQLLRQRLRLPRRCCVSLGALAAGTAVALATQRQRRGDASLSQASTLAELLPTDLDTLGSRRTICALGVQLLLFGGFTHEFSSGWQRPLHPPASLQERVDLITPTWKARGRVDYTALTDTSAASAASTLSLFVAAAELQAALPSIGTTVRSLADALESGMGMRPSDFDADARVALAEMLTWQLPRASVRQRLSPTGELTLLILSFDATPDCRSVTDCSRPGPTNELLAATASAFILRRAREHGQRVNIIAQWEVAAALRNLGTVSGVTAVGTPGRFENTARIYEHMLGHMHAQGACGDRGAGPRPARAGRTVLLAHPDHLRRALRIGETAFARAADGRACHQLPLVPALQPYLLSWPTNTSATPTPAPSSVTSGSALNMYADVAGRVHTQGTSREATWYDAEHGFFPDGEPQRWVHDRDVWICYEFWARAKGIATGVIVSELDRTWKA